MNLLVFSQCRTSTCLPPVLEKPVGTFSPGQEAAAFRSKGMRYQRLVNSNGDSLQSPELAPEASVIPV